MYTRQDIEWELGTMESDVQWELDTLDSGNGVRSRYTGKLMFSEN